MNIFSNKIVKKSALHLVIVFVFLIILGSISSFIFSVITIRELVEYDMSLVGAMHQNKDIGELSIITGEINKEDHQTGKDILSEYSYGTNMSSIFAHYKMIFFRNTSIVIIVISIFFVSAVMILSNSLNRVFKEIRQISSKMQVGDLTDMNVFSDINDGEIAILKSTINSLAKRSGYQVEALNKDKKLLNKMLTDISHQLKTPLSAIRMYNEIMLNKSEIEPKVRTEFLNQSKEQIDRIDWLVQGLLKMARIEANSIEMIKKPYYLADTIDTAIAPFYAIAKKKSIKLIVEATGEIILVHDCQWVAEAFGNIIKNAIEHTKEGGIIKVISDETPMTVEVRIQDNGEGIRKKDLAHIFKRFFQVEGQKTGSVGIGLELAREILVKNDADIYVNSEVGIGTEFVITFLKKS
ncbi:HAMP domain-containing sensor histidine kinase [Wukongibacter baidiensis]|uniref:sensor histidine kinase n=1 Tax=Wukongibacter baidiensis TaxID=1723361 RepID=UPI003D7FD551